MEKIITITKLLLLIGQVSIAQAPNLTNWWYNTTNNMYNSILTDVEAVYYDSNNIYVVTSGIPKYYVSGSSMFSAKDLNAVHVVPRFPTPSANPSLTPTVGSNGLTIDGVLTFPPGDARSYQNAGVWNQIAYFFELLDMDNSNGHSTPQQVYHHHFNNLKVHNTYDSLVHSPLVGFAWDGYPIYGPYGYKNNDGTGGIIRNTSSYTTKTYTTRPNGPNVGGMTPIGCYIEDWQYTQGHGTLDIHNGRLVVTPEYPGGTYAYFTTIDAQGKPYYPYLIGPRYYGVPTTANNIPGGNTVLPSGVTQYIPSGISSVNYLEQLITITPTYVTDNFKVQSSNDHEMIVSVYNSSGLLLFKKTFTHHISIDISHLPLGAYIVNLHDKSLNIGCTKRIIKY
jgi:hypothetical protein